MDSRQSESVCATVSTRHFLSLSKEVKNNGVKSAIRNRKNGGVLTENAKRDVRVMQAIAKRNGF